MRETFARQLDNRAGRLLGSFAIPSNRGHSAAVDAVFRACDGTGTRRCKEGDEFGHFTWSRWPSYGDAAKRVHQSLACALIVDLQGGPLRRGDRPMQAQLQR